MKLNYRLLPILLLFFLFGCEENLSPEQVASGFWSAVKNKDTKMIKKFISQESKEIQINKDEILSVSNFTLGRIVIDGLQSEIETEVTLASDEPVTLPITSYLLKENNAWKIDYKKTISKIDTDSDIANVLNSLSDMSKLFVDGLNESMEQMNKVLPKIEEGLSNLEDDIKSRIPELREKLDEFTRKLEEALKKQNKKEEKGTIEI